MSRTWTDSVRSPKNVDAPSRLPEDALFMAYATPTWVARPCVCGAVIVADKRDPSEAVRLHQDEPPHLAWRERYGL